MEAEVIETTIVTALTKTLIVEAVAGNRHPERDGGAIIMMMVAILEAEEEDEVLSLISQ